MIGGGVEDARSSRIQVGQVDETTYVNLSARLLFDAIHLDLPPTTIHFHRFMNREYADSTGGEQTMTHPMPARKWLPRLI